jgi:hypothetical protein
VYEVERKIDGTNGAFQLIQTVPTANCTTSVCRHTDAAVQPGIQYVYRVRAKTGSAVSSYSDQKSIRVLGPVAPPSIAIDDAAGPGNVKVTWNAVAGAQGYSVRYRTPTCVLGNDCDVSISPSNSSTSSNFSVVVPLQAGVPYQIRVQASNNLSPDPPNPGLNANSRSSADVTNVFSMDRPEVVSFCSLPNTPQQLRINFQSSGSSSGSSSALLVMGANGGEVWARFGTSGVFNRSNVLNFQGGIPSLGNYFPANPMTGVSSVIVPIPTGKTFFKIRVYNQFGSLESYLPISGAPFVEPGGINQCD